MDATKRYAVSRRKTGHALWKRMPKTRQWFIRTFKDCKASDSDIRLRNQQVFEHVKEYRKAYYQANKEKATVYDRGYRKYNRETFLAKQKVRMMEGIV